MFGTCNHIENREYRGEGAWTVSWRMREKGLCQAQCAGEKWVEEESKKSLTTRDKLIKWFALQLGWMFTLPWSSWKLAAKTNNYISCFDYISLVIILVIWILVISAGVESMITDRWTFDFPKPNLLYIC